MLESRSGWENLRLILRAFNKFYTSDHVVAEHTSPPMSEDVKITLKVSHNLHASMGQYFLGLYGQRPRRMC